MRCTKKTSGKRKSKKACPLNTCLEFLAGAWTPEILWSLREQPKRFGDLKRELDQISSKVLTARLRELQKQGLLTRKVLPSSPPAVQYSLTELGLQFDPVLVAIAQVSLQLKKR
jgi:DNA-binding HxlR family transcriptional regulator